MKAVWLKDGHGSASDKPLPVCGDKCGGNMIAGTRFGGSITPYPLYAMQAFYGAALRCKQCDKPLWTAEHLDQAMREVVGNQGKPETAEGKQEWGAWLQGMSAGVTKLAADLPQPAADKVDPDRLLEIDMKLRALQEALQAALIRAGIVNYGMMDFLASDTYSIVGTLELEAKVKKQKEAAEAELKSWDGARVELLVDFAPGLLKGTTGRVRYVVQNQKSNYMFWGPAALQFVPDHADGDFILLHEHIASKPPRVKRLPLNELDDADPSPEEKEMVERHLQTAEAVEQAAEEEKLAEQASESLMDAPKPKKEQGEPDVAAE